jgi:hypothetical protein
MTTMSVTPIFDELAGRLGVDWAEHVRELAVTEPAEAPVEEQPAPAAG